jgi:hypothetical protein
MFLSGINMLANDYSAADRLLHRLALGSSLVRRASFDIEALFAPKNRPPDNERHIFICGLARAGTTILVRSLYESRELCSLTYRNMPFVLMPQLWKRFSAPFHKQKIAKERAHGDGILINFDSPEAFEEVFWRCYCSNEYILDKCLVPHHVNEEIIDQFRHYISTIIASSDAPGQSRYLSKNNNNILRLNSIRRAFPAALIIVPFREPLQQARSLMTQHRNFLERHSKDRFSRDYMRWLGHHEFGATHKPFLFDHEAFSAVDYATGNINYWLNIWICTYRFLLEKAPTDCTFVCYEELCTEPEAVLENLFFTANLSLKKIISGKIIHKRPNKSIKGIDIELKNQAERIYQALLVSRSN